MDPITATILTTAAATITAATINNFMQSYSGEQVWECWPDEALREYELIQGERKNDKFPQGKEEVIKLLGYCYKNRKKYYVKANKTFPKWTWYYSLTK